MARLSLRYRVLRGVMRHIGFKKQMTGTAEEVLSRHVPVFPEEKGVDIVCFWFGG